MPYRSPKSGSVVNPGKRKKLPKSKVSSETQKKNRRKLAKAVVGAVLPLNTRAFRVANDKYKEGK